MLCPRTFEYMIIIHKNNVKRRSHQESLFFIDLLSLLVNKLVFNQVFCIHGLTDRGLAITDKALLLNTN